MGRSELALWYHDCGKYHPLQWHYAVKHVDKNSRKLMAFAPLCIVLVQTLVVDSLYSGCVHSLAFCLRSLLALSLVHIERTELN